jgi:hypothetical protein
MLEEVGRSTSPIRQIMRSLRRREYMSWVCQPPDWELVSFVEWQGSRGYSAYYCFCNVGCWGP